uniref:GP-PDE domain-containing protein n=1 Tax=Glossina morsitans morsitans TaxID=37546 RepID=A0A1B0FEH8_GLOMM
MQVSRWKIIWRIARDFRTLASFYKIQLPSVAKNSIKMSMTTVLPIIKTNGLLLDDHIKNCVSYAEAGAIADDYGVPRAIDDEPEVVNVCTSTLQTFTVTLDEPLQSNERVGLTGDVNALGDWQLNRCVVLNATNNNLVWTGNIMLEPCRNISYRYLVFVEDNTGYRQIRRWETHLKPRSLSTCKMNCHQEDRFGVSSNGEIKFNRGWITNESIVQFKFEREKMFQVHDIEKFDPDNILIKLIPLEEDLQTPLDPQNSAINVEVTKMQYGESQLQAQPSLGIAYKRHEIIIFHVTVPDPTAIAFALTFHSQSKEPLGRAIIRPSLLVASDGDLELIVTQPPEKSETVIALLTLPYLVVKPFSDVDRLNFRTTFAYYWPKSWPNLDVGHRGNGKSYIADPPAEPENTVASFLRAYESFADMVELDVHLTADDVPVVYHDFGVRTAPQGKTVKTIDQLEYILIKDITYEKLKNLRVFAIIDNEIKEYPSHNAEPLIEHRIFPRLKDILEALPKTLGLDVEIKWPQTRKCGNLEAEQTIDKNFFVDEVLKTIIDKGCGRPLIFSSFDPDICTMFRYKQNIFPVLFLTMGETKKWQPLMNLRTRTFEQAINNAQAFELAGTAPHAEDFLGANGANMIEKARNLGQAALVWGDDCNSKEAVKYFQNIGATAICYDRTDLNMRESKERAFFNSTDILAQFEDQCRP